MKNMIQLSIGRQWEGIKELAKNQKGETVGDLLSIIPYNTEQKQKQQKKTVNMINH